MDINDVNVIFENWGSISLGVRVALIVVGILIVLAAIFAIGCSIYLAIKYVKFNKKQNSCHMTGENIARTILDDNGLSNIKVKCSGSILFGNSYSHYFKKVRLRRRTWKKETVSSLAMASQKSCLAILDKENDPDMRTRVRLTPVIYFGPIAFIPLIIIGVIIDMVVSETVGTVTMVCCIIGLLFYVLSFIMSIMVLKTEVKAQNMAYDIVRASGLADEDEIKDMKELFRLYNIEYINDIVISLLEIILRVLQIVATKQASSSSSSSN